MQKLFLRYFLIFLSFFFSSFGFAKNLDRAADFRLIVTGGIQGLHGGESAFYRSPLFRLGEALSSDAEPLLIENAELEVFWSNDVVYFSFEKIGKNDVIQARFAKSDSTEKGSVQGLLGAQAFGVSMNSKNQIHPLDNNFLRRELGGIYGQFSWQVRQTEQGRIFAVDISGRKNEIQWPTSADNILSLKAVVGIYAKAGTKFIFFPRQIASTPRVFGVVDHLLSQRLNIPTRYVDLGNTLLSPSDESLSMAKKMHGLLQARDPVVLGASRYDLSALFQDKTLLETLPYVLALRGESSVPQSRVVDLGSRKVQFSALGDGISTGAGFLPKGLFPLTFEQSLQKSQSTAGKADLVIGLADNSQNASEAISKPIFDLVLSLVSDIKGALPAQDNIDLEKNHQEGLNSVAPLVRVSASDVTEVLVWADPKGYVNRLEIHRHPIVDSGSEAKDAQEILQLKEKIDDLKTDGLPQKQLGGLGQAWTQSDLDDVLGGILLAAKPNTELAILERTPAVTPIYSALPTALAQSLLERPGRAIWLSIRGKYIKRILKAAKENQFGLPIVLVGGDFKKATIGQRAINDVEAYRVVVTEKVLVAIDNFMAREGLFANSTLAASSVQTSLLEGSKDVLKILSELRKRDSSDDVHIGEKQEMLSGAPSVFKVVQKALSEGMPPKEIDQLIQNAPGKRHHTLVFDISDLDFGLKFNHTNAELLQWQDDNKKLGTSFTESRFWDQNYLNLLIYAKAALKYYGPLVDAELSFSEKFFQPNSLEQKDKDALDKILKSKQQLWSSDDEKTFNSINNKLRPVKDTTKIVAEVRVPFAKMMERTFLPSLGLHVLSNLTYETQLWPNIWMTPTPKWPQRVNDGRLLLGIGGSPAAILQTFQMGGVLGYDFSRNSAVQSFATGFEISGAGRWNVGVFVLKLESSLRKVFPIITPEKGRMGLIWLTDSKLEVPIYGGFSLSAMLNLTVGAQMDNPWSLGTNTLFGLALSYGGNFKWLL